MKRILIALFALVLTLGFNLAEAKRLGGGGSFGMSRSTAPMQRQSLPPRQAAPQPAAPPAPSAPPPAPARPGWGGVLGGLALGAGLGALLGGFGGGMGGMGGGGLLTLLLVVGGVILVARLLARRMPAAPPRYAAADDGAPLAYEAPQAVPAGAGAAPAPATPPTVPADFDSAGFLRQAKLNFVRLQAANDAGNMADIKTFSTPEFFAEIEMQYLERGKAAQQTDVVQLDADLVEVVTEGARHIASVRFHGLIREAADAAPTGFDEVWHLVKPASGNDGWRVAGLQQVN